MNKALVVLSSLLFFIFSLNAQNFSAGWQAGMQPAKVFIENKGQFHIPGSKDEVLFAVDHAENSVFFTRSGVTYTFLKQWRKEKDEEEREREKKMRFDSPEEYKKHEEEEHKVEFDSDMTSFKWLGANPDVKIVAEEVTSDYYSYSFKQQGQRYGNINYVKAYKRITYRDLYPGIDVVYEFHPVSGLKYAVHLKPGADISMLRMEYDSKIKMQGNDLHIATKFGDIIDHAPLTFYSDNKNAVIPSSFIKEKNTVSFQLGGYDKTREVIIDPWVQSPTFGATTWHCVWECEKDGAGNVYIIGGGASQTAGSQMMLKKYNSTGTLQWTYVTPYDTSNCWLGTFATDNAGNSYVTAGSVAQIIKVDNAGNLIWNNASPGGILSSAEFWNIVFNCDQSKLVIGGTGGPLLSLEAVIYNVDVNTGNISSQASVAVGPMSSIPPNLQEVRAISSCQNGRYYFLTHDTIGYINQNFTLCPSGSTSLYKISNGVDFGYKSEDYRFDNSGIMAIRADSDYVYVNKGNQIQKRDLNTLAVIAQATIPGGALNAVFMSGNTVSNSGIDIDACGNIYVGSKNQVVKFDQNLNQVATYTCSFNVYDVHVTSAGDIIACGSTGTSSTNNRTGSVQTFAAAACSPLALTCCDASICLPGSKCISDPAFNLTVATAGGTFSGTGITNASSGTFNPSVAGVGTHTVTYTLPCGTQSITITVNSCAALNVCQEANGDLTVSGGSGGPYTWYHQVTTQDCSACIFGCNFPAGCAVNVTSWQSFATGSTVNPSTGSYPMYVVNANGDSAYIATSSGIPSCNSCALVPQLVSQTNVSCNGGNTGSATVNATGGSGANTYSWAPSGGTNATATNLAAGTYTCTITNGACTTTQTVTITQPAAITTTTASTAASCGNANGSATVSASGGNGSLNYSWTPGGQTTSAISNVTGGTYTCTITDANACTQTVSVVVGSTGTPSVSVSSQTNVACSGTNTGSATVSASGGSGTYTYSWAPSGGSAATASNLAAGNYTVTVNDGSCTSTQTVSITQPSAITTSTASTASSCGSSNGSASVTASGGTGTLSYSWAPGGQTTSSVTNVAGGTYTCTITDANACTQTVSVVVNSTGGASVTLNSQTNVTCNGGNNGNAAVTASGGSGTYTYSWAPSGGSAATATNLAAGVYTVSVDDGSCITTQTVTITEPAAITTSTASTAASCGISNGTASVNASGGTGVLTYSWSPGGQTTSAISSLAGGTYTCTITDASSCTQTVSVIVASSGGASVAVSSQTNVSCNGGNNGSAAVNASGGSGTYTYSWSPSGGTNASATNLSAGIYTVSVNDGSCITTQTVTITEPAVITTTTVSTNSSCGGNTGSATVTASGGTGTLSYSWLPGGQTTAGISNIAAGTYTCTISDANACTQSVTVVVNSIGGATVSLASQTNITCNGGSNGSATVNAGGGSGTLAYSWSPSGGTTATANGLTAGTYTCTVTDGAGCVSSQTVVITQPPAITTSTASVNASCGQSDGTATVNASGGTGTLSYSWSPGGQTTAGISSLAAGTYTCTITDANACTSTVSVTVASNGGPLATASSNGPICSGGTLMLNAGGGGTYSWSGPLGFTSTQQNPVISNISTSMTGVYTVTVTSSGCSNTATVSVVVNPSPVVTVTATSDTIFTGESVVITASGATSYVWSGTGNTASSITITAAAEGLYTYCVFGSNANSCSDSDCVDIYVKAYDCGELYLPSAFSPNSDGSNDDYRIFGSFCIQSLKFVVFDRWGEKVFESTDPDFRWDGKFNGKELNSAVFGYYLEAILKNGDTVTLKGNISLVK